MTTIRIDGNDLFAVFAATKEARRLALEEGRPTLIEAMTYRLGHHSTSDDSSAYRTTDEVKFWDKTDHPIGRLRRHLLLKSYWSDDEEKRWETEARKSILEAFAKAEKKKKPSPSLMFSDVYAEIPSNLVEQEKQMRQHVEKYKEHYPVDRYDP